MAERQPGRPAGRSAAAGPLLTPQFLAQLRALKGLLFLRHHRGELHGGVFGQSPEFDTYRPYFPGDDPRYLDWNVYARMEKMLLKLFLKEEEGQVCVLLDTSASMRAAGGAKARLAARFAAAFAYLALCNNRHVRLGAFADGLLGTRGPLRGLGAFPACQDFFTAPRQGNGTSLGKSLGEFLNAVRDRSRVFVVSDFLQESDVLAEIAWLRSRREELHLVQVLDQSELQPRLRGEWVVADAEGADRLSLLIGEDLLGRLQRAVREYVADLQSTCRRLAVPCFLASTAQPFEPAFLGHLFGRPAA